MSTIQFSIRRDKAFPRAVLVAIAGICFLVEAGHAALGADDTPSIQITQPAPFGEGGEFPRSTIAGKAKNSKVTDCKVVIYTLTNQWYVQPFVASPFTTIDEDGSWAAEIALGRTYAALLVKPPYTPAPTLSELPKIGGDVLAIHTVEARREGAHNPQGRTVRFSGLEWRVKTSEGLIGPGPNYFSDLNDNVLIDSKGRLHLHITRHEKRWECAEIISTQSFGYGTYRFYIDSDVDQLDPNAVLGCFTWSDDPAYSHREIDIEVSRWGDEKNDNAQFVVQPYTQPRNIVRFSLPKGLGACMHSFIWEPERVLCESCAAPEVPGHDKQGVIRGHTFVNDVPKAGGENARINLWLFNGDPPIRGKDVEVVIGKFEFKPLP